ncbi:MULTISPECIES: rhodanese-like domain-containing protein [unclassified Janthinobacterium]|uniref:rhodanese-like domain-containing protein n=1 Tax=unclassified Janthinobacterium TaxID=2610881 RepID=UPI00161A73CC|nr:MULTISPECIES: rhodanese-like domain-containing protein [unclassified Janthinobacterium]MBB5370730.1 rhodanese-related sulfurtransferase [Janthinobacterium sp. K2C7]MBB5383536.1 rhodanese-related sulfurtransferase [Janthinobacterium sp. K2Li3]MBB5388990.1 rhodanese-related sulfurtransferase [Janthinobacterium sp. K2E3]
MAVTVAATELNFDPRAIHGDGAFEAVLNAARAQAQAQNLPYAGIVSAQDAWQLVQANKALLVDVRTNEERIFVGHVPESLHVAWATGTSMNRNPRFTRELEAKVRDKAAVVLLLCRSGKRSALAAEAAAKAGFTNVFNIAQGFEGDLDDQQQRGHSGGWRWHALPWLQD